MKKMKAEPATSSATWDMLESFARKHVQGFIQPLLEEEVTELLGRPKSTRRGTMDVLAGARNGHGKMRNLALMTGTIVVRRPWVRDLVERFVSRQLPLF